MGMFNKLLVNISADDDEKQRINEGEKIIKEIMGTKMKANRSFFLKLHDVGISTRKLWSVWHKINKKVKSELYDGILELQDIPLRIDQLILENKSQKKIQEEEEYKQKLVDMGIINFDFESKVRINSREHLSKNLVDGGYTKIKTGDVNKGYCFVQKDKLIIKTVSVKKKTSLGEKIIHYDDITGIDFQSTEENYHNSAKIIINTLSSEPITLIGISKDNFEILNEAWISFKNDLNKSKVVKELEHNNVDELMKYAELYEKGFLTKEEFEAKKKELL